ncbi:auxin-responsive protein SAUR32-like [Canna indica]|uniref:Auxin-responsive protein SAUR32-like n=1 Tax=Canna indica TaxID=4628 RepID=A0AAQ3JTT3_9LILI|nr:auxin-responsive protein SAUR32-like [Canna indica]
MQEEKRTTKVKKGWLTVRVGLEGDDGGFRRFAIPISYLYHPLFMRLLESAREVYGFRSSGPLRLPCSVDDFLHLRWLIERETQHSHSLIHPHSFPLHSC